MMLLLISETFQKTALKIQICKGNKDYIEKNTKKREIAKAILDTREDCDIH